jgi:hypothetical protein
MMEKQAFDSSIQPESGLHLSEPVVTTAPAPFWSKSTLLNYFPRYAVKPRGEDNVM